MNADIITMDRALTPFSHQFQKHPRITPKQKNIQSCLHNVPSFSVLKNNIASIKHSLEKYGICLLLLEYSDNQGESLKWITSVIGKPHSHDNLKRITWDVRVGGCSGNEFLARSHGFKEFPLHTDCSYELQQPSFFGLQVIQQDRFGGGVNLIVDVASLVKSLTAETIFTLQTQPVKILVPQEFRKKKVIYMPQY